MCAALFPKHAFLKGSDTGSKLVSDHMTLILVLLLPLNAQPKTITTRPPYNYNYELTPLYSDTTVQTILSMSVTVISFSLKTQPRLVTSYILSRLDYWQLSPHGYT